MSAERSRHRGPDTEKAADIVSPDTEKAADTMSPHTAYLANHGV